MPSDPFVILGVSKDASQSEIQEAYEKLRKQYQEHVFDEGESGAEAARQLGIIEDAYNQCMEAVHEGATVSGEGDSVYETVRQALSSQNLELAQQELDKISYRGAEWHYLQAAVFYKKNWLNDSKKQLEIAVQMDPTNQKYLKELDTLRHKTDGTKAYDTEGSQGVYNNTAEGSARSYSSATNNTADTCCATCQALWCADCCCECMGGDLIRCC